MARPLSPDAAGIPVPPGGIHGPRVFRGQLVGDVPQEPPGFQPRTGLLAELDRAALGALVVRAVAGRRGVGTTQLAAAYARARVAAGWRLVAWVNAQDERTLLAGLAEVADAVGLSGCAGRGADAGLVVRRRLETDGDRCLLVFDDADDLDALRPFVPAAGAARVLITSHQQSMVSLGAGVQVDVFTLEEAVAFLAERTGMADAEEAAAVAAELGYLPLALAQAGAVIARQHRGYRTYLERLRGLWTEEYLVKQRGQPYPPGVAEAVLLSLDAARAGDRADVCTGVMEVMAVLSAAGVCQELLHAAGQAGALAMNGARVAADLVNRALTRLAGHSLLTFSLDGGTIIAHRLVTRVIRDGLARQGRLTAVCLAAACVLEMRAEALKGSPDRVAVRDIPEQVTALLDNLAGSAGEPDEELAQVLLRLRFLALTHLIELDDNVPQAVALADPLTADFERILGPDHPGTLRSRDSLAAAYQAAGQADEAIPLFERTLAARERLLGPDHPDTATSRDHLAAAYQAVGRADEAIPLHERALAACEPLLGPDHPDMLACRDNLATAYRDVGRADEAIPLHERALAGYEPLLGPDHPDTLACRDNLALAHWAAGRADEAIPLFERTLAARERALGPDHPGTLTSRNNLAAAHWAAGRADEAIPLHEQTLAARERVLGPDHPGTLTSRNNLAAAFVDAGRADEAIPLLEQTLAARERVLGPYHPRTQTSRDNLAIARSRRSKRSAG
jgi:tetratricopeptide (TPR) repeat protein